MSEAPVKQKIIDDRGKMPRQWVTWFSQFVSFGLYSVDDTEDLTSTTVDTADADAVYGAEEAALINETKADFNLLRADVSTLKDKVDEILSALRKTGGSGVLND